MPSPFSPIDEYAFLSNCHTGALVAADGAVDWLCVPRFDSASVFGSAARPGGRGLPAGAVRDQRPGGAGLRGRHQHPGHDLEDPDRLGRGPRRPDHGPAPGRGPGHPPHPAPGRRRRRPSCWSGRPGAWRARSRSSWSASRCSTTAAPWPSGRWWTGPPRRRRQRAGGDRAAGDQHGAGDRGQPGPGPHRSPGRAARGARCRGPRAWPSPPTSRTPIAAWPRRRGSGAPGWAGPASPTTAGASRSSGRPWPSRASPTCRPGPPWPRSPPRCPRPRAGSATGTTATPGCATAPSPSRRCTGSTWTGRPTSSCSSSPTWSPTPTAPLQIMYGIDGRRDLTETTRDDLSGYAGARPVRVGNGAFDQRQNDVYGAVLDSILLHTRRSQRLPRRLWPIVRPRPAAPSRCGASPTRASGRPGASPSTMCRPS